MILRRRLELLPRVLECSAILRYVLYLPDPRQDLFQLSFSQFVTAEDGVMGLAQYGNSAGMRISFAKDPISVLRQQCKEKEMELIEGDQRAT